MLQIKVRYVPQSLGGSSFFGAAGGFTGYPVKAVLPDSFLMRRNNKGLENAAVSPDGKTAWTMMQVGWACGVTRAGHSSRWQVTAAGRQRRSVLMSGATTAQIPLHLPGTQQSSQVSPCPPCPPPVPPSLVITSQRCCLYGVGMTPGPPAALPAYPPAVCHGR